MPFAKRAASMCVPSTVRVMQGKGSPLRLVGHDAPLDADPLPDEDELRRDADPVDRKEALERPEVGHRPPGERDEDVIRPDVGARGGAPRRDLRDADARLAGAELVREGAT